MQYACNILSSVACPVLPYFSTLFHVLKKIIEHEMCVLIFTLRLVSNVSCYM